METTKKPRYGFVAWKYFAWMGVIGSAGLVTLLMTFLFPLDLSIALILRLICIPTAFVGLYIGAAYVFLYEKAFKVERCRDNWAKIADLSGLKGDEKVLDVGCGTGRVSIALAKKLPKGKVVGIDIFRGVSGNSPETPKRNAQAEGVADRVDFKHGNALKIPFEDGTFDVVTMGSVLHELHSEKDKEKALREISRVLKPRGEFLALEILRNKRLALPVLLFAFVWKPKEYWLKLLERSGFRHVTMHPFRSLIDLGLFRGDRPIPK